MRYKPVPVRVLFIENHDSFSWNVIDALPFERDAIEVASAAQARAALPGADLVVMGPGPMDPVRAGLVELVRETAARKLPFFGVCLGHQALGLAFGATLQRTVPSHGERAQVRWEDGRTFQVMRYHSLSLSDVRPPLRVTARLDDGTVMALAHAELPMASVQFHPDSFGTPQGRALLTELLTRQGAMNRAPTQQRASPRQGAMNRASRRRGVIHHALNLSELDRRDDFTLLAPEFSGTGEWTLVDLAQPGDAGVWFAPAEGNAERHSGTARHVALNFDVAPATLDVRLDERGFEDGVRHIRERIAAGDVYQVNLTTRAALGLASGSALLARFCARGVPRFAAWVKSSRTGEFVSASPELLVETAGRWIHVEPMKGTAPTTAELLASHKDEAELAMITDLLRDDLHRLCVPASVRVTNERRLIELPYAVQSVADVEGALREDVTLREVFRVVHPGGSVTGAPRRAALELIAALETSPRGAYCGTLGLELDDTLRASLLIRTAQRLHAGWSYGVGGGITWNSTPEGELAEVRLKLGALR